MFTKITFYLLALLLENFSELLNKHFIQHSGENADSVFVKKIICLSVEYSLLTAV